MQQKIVFLVISLLFTVNAVQADTSSNYMNLDSSPSTQSPAAAANQAINHKTAVTHTATTNKADDNEFIYGLGINLSTLGLGVQGATSFNKYFSMNIVGDYFQYTYDSSWNGTHFDARATLTSVQLLGNYHPFAGAFRLVGGAVYNGNNVNLNAPNTGEITINGEKYYSNDLSSVTGTIKFNPVAPYAGIGWGGSHDAKGFGVTFDMGVIFQGIPQVSLTPNYGPLATPAERNSIDQSVAQTQNQIANDLNFFAYYPVVNLGVYYRW